MGPQSCGLVNYLVFLRSILCPSFVLCITGQLTPENYISQVPLLTGFLFGSANESLCWQLEVGQREKPEDFSPPFFAVGCGLVSSLGPAPTYPPLRWPRFLPSGPGSWALVTPLLPLPRQL